MHAQIITSQEAERILTPNKWKYTPVGLFIVPEKDGFIGIDNSTGDAWTEEFATYQHCIDWLKNKED